MYDRVRVNILDTVTPPKIARHTRPTMQFHYALFCNTIAMSLKRFSRIYPRWIAQCGKIRKTEKINWLGWQVNLFHKFSIRPEFDSFLDSFSHFLAILGSLKGNKVFKTRKNGSFWWEVNPFWNAKVSLLSNFTTLYSRYLKCQTNDRNSSTFWSFLLKW